MTTVKVAEAHSIWIRNYAQKYEADVLILDGRIVRIIYYEIPGIGRQCVIREDQDLWFDDLLLQEKERVWYGPNDLECDLRKYLKEEFESESKKAISLAYDSDLRNFYEHLSDGPLKDLVKEEQKKRIEGLKKELERLQVW